MQMTGMTVSIYETLTHVTWVRTKEFKNDLIKEEYTDRL